MKGDSTRLAISWHRLDDLVAQLCQEIRQDFDPDFILAVARGGLIPGVCLSHQLEMDNESFKSIRVKTNKSNKSQPKKTEPEIGKFDFRSLKGQKVLVIDDVVASGNSLMALKNKLAGKCSQVMIAALTRINREEWDIPSDLIDYLGLSLQRCVLFPWETEDKFSERDGPDKDNQQEK